MATISMIKSQFALILTAALVFFTNLGVPYLWDEDEPRNAACAREMLDRSDWVVPTFNYELRPQKPVLLYWLIMASYSMFGVNELAARLPSALLAVGTTLVTFHLGRLLFAARVGLLAGAMMATCLMFGVAGRAATPDSCLIFFTSCSFLAYVWAVRRGTSSDGVKPFERALGDAPRDLHYREFLPRRWLDFVFIYGAMAVAVIAKGPVGLALPAATIGLFLLLNHHGGEHQVSRTAKLKLFALRLVTITWAMRPLTLLAVVLLIAGPWYALVALRTDGEWTRTFFAEENLARFRTPMEGHSGPIIYYAGAILVGFFPWSVMLPAGVWFASRDAFRAAARRPSYLLLVCWAGVWIGVFSLAGTKLPSYVLPAYPALALITAAFVDRWLDEPACVPPWLMRIAWMSLAAVGVGIMIGLPLAARRFLPGEELIGLIGVLPLVGGVAGMLLAERRKLGQAVAVLGVMAALFCVALFGGVAVRASQHQNSASLIEIAREGGGDLQLATFAHPESSVIYYAGRRVEHCSQPTEVARFFARASDGFLITNADRWNELLPYLPPDATVVERQPRFLKAGEVLLVKRTLETADVRANPRR